MTMAGNGLSEGHSWRGHPRGWEERRGATHTHTRAHCCLSFGQGRGKRKIRISTIPGSWHPWILNVYSRQTTKVGWAALPITVLKKYMGRKSPPTDVLIWTTKPPTLERAPPRGELVICIHSVSLLLLTSVDCQAPQIPNKKKIPTPFVQRNQEALIQQRGQFRVQAKQNHSTHLQ